MKEGKYTKTWTHFHRFNNAKEIVKQISLLSKDWALTPLKEKRPFRQNWQHESKLTFNYIVELIDKGEILTSKRNKKYRSFASGIGLRTGDISNGIIAIDIDGSSALELGKRLPRFKTLPPTISYSSGKKGREQRLFKVPDEYRAKLESFNRIALSEWGNYKCDEGEQLEFRYNGCQSVLPPSYHPETGSYQWINNPQSTDLAELPKWLAQFLLSQTEESSNNQGEQRVNIYEQYLSELQYPVDIEIPLELCIATNARSLLDGVSKGGRDNSGALIIRDLIGTANYLDKIGQRYGNTPLSLLQQYCNNCSPSLNDKDCDRIYRSALKDNPSPSLDEHQINNCIAGYYWRNSNVKELYIKQKQQSKTGTVSPIIAKSKARIPLRELIDRAKEILNANLSSTEQTIQLDELREEAGMNDRVFEKKVIKPIETDLDRLAKKLDLDIAFYLAEPDRAKKALIKSQVCGAYRITSFDFEDLVRSVEVKHTTAEKFTYSFEDFMNKGIQSCNWLVPSLLPIGETLLLTALPKVGKTLFATDVVAAVLKGSFVLGEKANKGKVLYIGSDESSGSLIRRFTARGFDLMQESKENLRIVPEFDLLDMGQLEQELEDFRPSLVVLDSLTSITNKSAISENDAEFARQIYKLKDLLKKYNASSILIHHENKNADAKGISKISGSARIPAAVWGIAQMSGAGDVDDNESSSLLAGNVVRYLDVLPREGEKVQYRLEINPKDRWSDEGILRFMGETDDPKGDKRKHAERVLELLTNSKLKLEYSEINNHLNIGKSLYTVLDRLCDRQMINKTRSENNPRRWVYFVINNDTNDVINNNNNNNCSTINIQNSNPNGNPPKKCVTPYLESDQDSSINNNKTIDIYKLEVSQQTSQQTNSTVNNLESVDNAVSLVVDKTQPQTEQGLNTDRRIDNPDNLQGGMQKTKGGLLDDDLNRINNDKKEEAKLTPEQSQYFANLLDGIVDRYEKSTNDENRQSIVEELNKIDNLPYEYKELAIDCFEMIDNEG